MPPKSKMLGARLALGPMADDRYTRLHNRTFRGGIPTRYVGVFGYIASHREGWKIAQEKVARDLGVGVAFIRSALLAIEEAGCLIRTRERNTDGTLGDAVWFITDLPMELRELGTTDEAVIAKRVQAAYEASQCCEGPISENCTLDVTCGNATDDECFCRSEPKCDQPTLAEPTLADRTPKKNLEKKTFEEEPSSSGAGARTQAPRGHRPTPEEENASGNTPQPQPEAELATSAITLADQLPGHLGVAQRRQLAADIHQALTSGWPPDRLTQELTRDIDSARRPAAVYRHRLRLLPGSPPPARTSGRAGWPPRCGHCDENRHRQIPDGRVTRCPACHPAMVGAA